MSEAPKRLRACRRIIGERLGMDSPLSLEDMARALGLSGANATKDLLKMERGARPISGVLEELTLAIMDGYVPQGARRLVPGRHSRKRLTISDDAMAQAVADAGGNLSEAARTLGCSVSVVCRRMAAIRADK